MLLFINYRQVDKLHGMQKKIITRNDSYDDNFLQVLQK